MDEELDKDELIRLLDRQLKLRALLAFEDDAEGLGEIEREFAEAALDMVRRQPAMADLAGIAQAGSPALPPLPYFDQPVFEERH